jgi:hypothetical protein
MREKHQRFETHPVLALKELGLFLIFFAPAIRIVRGAQRSPGVWPVPPRKAGGAQSLLDRVYVFMFWFPFDSSAMARG